MLDRNWIGEVAATSLEFPHPLIQINRVEERLGNAANVARNGAILRAKLGLLSVIADEAAPAVRRFLRKGRIAAQLHTDDVLGAAVNLRVVRRQQKFARVDSLYREVNILTPNRAEFRGKAGRWKRDLELTRKAHARVPCLELGALIITRSAEGLTVYRPRARHHVSTRARQDDDLKGAGDTAAATLVMLASVADFEEAVRVQRAAGTVITKFGTSVVYPQELLEKAVQGNPA